ncbi:hypothetical protein [Nonomuraea lactucae]|uniref:hypothetical protein n=1 Tax=Nonomuraea lactucae TaxID=2249762 RepID=UPI001963C125|nr:hypothetical protein [Nonomuraea lactucae]
MTERRMKPAGTTPATADGGYSGTPLARKIGVKSGHRVRLLHAPDQWDIPDLPQHCTIVGQDMTGADITIAFYRSHSRLSVEASELVEDLADQGMLWIAWPRRAAGHDSDVTENALRELFLPLGVVDVKVAALGEDWSGLKFVRRRENRGNLRDPAF